MDSFDQQPPKLKFDEDDIVGILYNLIDGWYLFEYVDNSEDCVAQMEHLANYIVNCTDNYSEINTNMMPFVYNITDALGTFGALARDCYETTSASSSKYDEYIPNNYTGFFNRMRMNAILKYTSIDENSLEMWAGIESGDFPKISFHLSRIIYYLVINGEEENWNDDLILMQS